MDEMEEFLQAEIPTDPNYEILSDLRSNGKGWVFWSQEKGDRCERTPWAPFSGDPDVIDSTMKGIIESSFQWFGRRRTEAYLMQFWKAIEIGGRVLLTTEHQPFGFLKTNVGLSFYRMKTYLRHKFYVDEESEEGLGLPGRVFRRQQPESTPNVQYYSYNEYPQLHVAVESNITACWAVPVFETSGRCIGVLEVVIGSEITPSFHLWGNGLFYRSPPDGALRTYKCNHHEEFEVCKDDFKEIKKMLQKVCMTHKLPLAQAWVLCELSNHLFRRCLFKYREENIFPFLDVCGSHELQKGQGVVGTALSSHNLVFCKDISQFRITDYPLAHHAREHGLKGSFAICLQKNSIGGKVYVLEFFLPTSNTEYENDSLLTAMKPLLHRSTGAFGRELGEELSIEVINFSGDGKPNSSQMLQTARSPNRTENREEVVRPDLSDRQLPEVVDAIDTGNNNVFVGNTEESNIIAVTSLQQTCMINSAPRQHRKAGIPISLKDIQQRSGMKLDDAAESLNVSRSTLKRACREYNIFWWSARKRNKNNNSPPNNFVQGAAQDQIPESSQPPISNPPHNQDLATASCTEPHFVAAQDTSTVTIKAKYGEEFIKFQLPVSSGMVEFQRQVAKRLGGTYRVTYQDDENDWVIIGCDEDLQEYLRDSKGRNPVKVSLQPITNCPP